MSEHEHPEHIHNDHHRKDPVHTENCSCGHNHDVQHDCGAHDHHTHDEYCGCSLESRDALGAIHVESHLHDEARVISGNVTLYTDYDKLKAVLSEQLELLAKAVQECGGIVGHIKASVEIKRVEMFSVTDVAVSVKAAPGQEIKINMASIVFLINPEEAEILVTRAMEAVKAGV